MTTDNNLGNKSLLGSFHCFVCCVMLDIYSIAWHNFAVKTKFCSSLGGEQGWGIIPENKIIYKVGDVKML